MLLGLLLIGLSVISANRSTTAADNNGGSVAVSGVAENAALLRGIPQHANLLGSPTAPIQLIEYADPQCPYCAQYARDVLPPLVREYVRAGQVQMVFRGIWFLGADSETALRTAAAAASENKFWNVLELLYRNQGAENAWVNDQLLRSIVTAAGADATRVFAARGGAAVQTMIDRWGGLAQADGINAVPAFFLGPRGGPLQRLQITTIAAPEFRTALDTALKR
jgi:protein-disulfide isomerase